MERRLKQGAKAGPEDEGGVGFGVEEGEGCRFDLQRRYEESERRLGTVHRTQAAKRDGRAQHLRYIYWSRGHQRERDRMAGGWRGEGGSWRQGEGTGGNKADSLTHGRTHIQCSWSRSCRPSAHGQRRRFLWSYRPPCGSLHLPACQKPAPER